MMVMLDFFRILAALLVAAIHTSPLAAWSGEADFFLTRVLARVAVPSFFMVTGQFILGDCFQENFSEKGKQEACGQEQQWGSRLLPGRVRRYLKKLLVLYGASIVLYLPVGLYAGHYEALTVKSALRMLLFDGTFYHLWYFPACILGLLLVCVLCRFLKCKGAFAVAGVLYLIGLFGDSYYGLVEKVSWLAAAYEKGFGLWSYTRNGLFLAPLFLLLGAVVGKGVGKRKEEEKEDRKEDGKEENKRKNSGNGWKLLLSFSLMTAEAFTLKCFGLQRHDSMYLLLVPTMLFLYQLLLEPAAVSESRQGNIEQSANLTQDKRRKGNYACKSASVLRSTTAGIYILHPAMIIVVRGAAKVTGMTVLIENSLLHYLLVSCLSGATAFFLAVLLQRWKEYTAYHASGSDRKSVVWIPAGRVSGIRLNRENHSGNIEDRARTWIEIDFAALRNNVDFLQARLSEHCRLMPVIKANAYGHGAAALAKELNRMGIDAFCVACIQEGIALRRAGIRGEILILGYTPPARFDELRRYRLSQTVVDYAYAQQLHQYGKKLHVHVGIDTGMHRLGERCENMEEICSIFTMDNLIADGILTHLSADERRDEPDKTFTEGQAAAFYDVFRLLEEQGVKCPKIHLQASYGVLNYPELAGDYARVGLALYGVLGARADSLVWKDKLCPVLSLKTKVAVVKEILPGESVGYGLSFVAEHSMKIAALTIGYADGLPRALSNGKGSVLIHGKKAPVVGLICMDQTLVDISSIPDVRPGETAVVIGQSEGEEIAAYDLAQQAGTITNEILSRLGARVEYSVKNS